MYSNTFKIIYIFLEINLINSFDQYRENKRERVNEKFIIIQNNNNNNNNKI